MKFKAGDFIVHTQHPDIQGGIVLSASPYEYKIYFMFGTYDLIDEFIGTEETSIVEHHHQIVA